MIITRRGKEENCFAKIKETHVLQLNVQINSQIINAV